MAEGFRDLLSGWEEWRPRADEYRELDAELILVLDHFSGRGKTSGLEVRQMRTEGAALFHHQAGKVRRLVVLGPEPGAPRA